MEKIDTFSAGWGAALVLVTLATIAIVDTIYELVVWLIHRKTKKRTGGSFRELYEDNKTDGDDKD